jgi:hypothetical protein
MKPSLRHCLVVLTLSAPLTFQAPATAQDIDTAKALFIKGAADMTAHVYEAACPAFAESLRLDPRLGTLFSLAACEDEWGHIATAVKHYGEYLVLFEQLPEDRKPAQRERPEVAKAQREKLAPAIPELTLTLPPGAPPGTVVKRDGQVMAEAALGVALAVDPVEHALTTQAPGGAVWEQRIKLGKGEKRKMMLEVKAPPDAAPPSAPHPLAAALPGPTAPPAAPAVAATGPGGQRVAAYVIGSVGLAGFVIGGIIGGLAIGQKGIIDQHCGTAIKSMDPTACGQTGLDATVSAKSLALGSTIGLGVGTVGVATATILLLTAPKSSKPATSAGISWITAGILSAGPARAMLGVRGAW